MMPGEVYRRCKHYRLCASDGGWALMGIKKGDGAVSECRTWDRRGWTAQGWEGRMCPEGPRMENTNTNRSGRERGKVLCGKEKERQLWTKIMVKARWKAQLRAMMMQRAVVGIHSNGEPAIWNDQNKDAFRLKHAQRGTPQGVENAFTRAA